MRDCVNRIAEEIKAKLSVGAPDPKQAQEQPGGNSPTSGGPEQGGQVLGRMLEYGGESKSFAYEEESFFMGSERPRLIKVSFRMYSPDWEELEESDEWRCFVEKASAVQRKKFLCTLKSKIHKYGLPDTVIVDDGICSDNESNIKYPRAECVAANEVQIEAKGAMPLAGNSGFPTALWYRVTPETVTICWRENGIHKTEEFDAQDIQLSNIPAAPFSDENEQPDDSQSKIKSPHEAGGKEVSV